MKDILANITSVSWWVGVVLVGIAINLVSAYLKPRLDLRLTSASHWWAKRSYKRAQEHAARINSMVEDPNELLACTLYELRFRIREVVCFLFGFAFFGFAIVTKAFAVGTLVYIGLMLVSILMVLAGLTDHIQAMALNAEAWEARESVKGRPKDEEAPSLTSHRTVNPEGHVR